MLNNERSIQEYLEIVSKRRNSIIYFIIVCVITSGIYSILQPNIYKASATLLVDMETPNILNVKDVLPLGDSDYRSYQEYLLTQIEILKSRNIAKEVFECLKLRNHFQKKNGVLNKKHWFTVLKNRLFSIVQMIVKKTETVPLGKEQAINDFKYQEMLKEFQDDIEVTHQRDTRLLTVSFEDEDSNLAASIVNTLSKIYLRKNLDRKVTASKDAAEWLIKEIENLKTHLKTKEDELQHFRQINNLISPDERREIIDRTLFELNLDYSEAKSRLAEYSKRYRKNHPKMQQTMELIQSLKNMIKTRREEAILFEKKLIEYNDLIREVNLNQKLLEDVLTRQKETLIASTFNSNNISIVEEAVAPEKPVRPKRTLNVFLAFLFGILGGISVAFLQESLIRNIQSGDDFKKFNIAFLGYVPFIKKTLISRKNFRDAYVIKNQKGIISEIFNNLRTSILLYSDDNKAIKGKSFVITSFLPGEGKTLLSCNIAEALAKFNFRIILVEADLRKPRMKHVFHTEHKLGLSDYLQANSTIEQVITPGPLKNLDLLLSGSTNIKNPSEALGSDKMKNLVKSLESKYDLIIIDSPPVFAVTDPILLSSFVKRVIIVAKHNSTPKKLIPIMKEKLHSARAKIIGVIINQVKNAKNELSEYPTDYYGY